MKFALPFVALVIFSCSSGPTATLDGDIALNTPISGTLEENTPASYSIEVAPNTFLAGSVDQLTVDVVVTLYDGEDKEIASFDDPARGLENFMFSMEEGGTYRLEVSPFKDETGDYSVLINTVEPIATNKNARADQLLSLFDDDAPGAVIGIVDNGQLVYSKAYGKANLTHNLDFKLNTPTNIGSVSKQFTAYAILLLEEQGLLSIDDDIHDHFPELPDFGATITVANLMNHTNGFREVYNLMPIAGWQGEDFLLRSEVINTIKNQKELQAQPNTEFNYNNSAFIMLAELVERKTDLDFPEWMKLYIFEPLDMQNTYVRRDPAQIIPGASQGYIGGEGGFVEAGDLFAAYGAGGIYTTPEDLSKWLANFNQPTVGNAALIQKLVTPRVLKNGDTLDYAFGIGVGAFNGLKRYSHTGADIAHRAAMQYYPEINSGVIALSNNGSFTSGAIASDLAELYFADSLTLEEDQTTQADSLSETVTVAQEILEGYLGKFKFQEIPIVLEFTIEDGVLQGQPTGQDAVALTPESDTTFVNNKFEVKIVFNTAADGTTNAAAFSQGPANYTLERIPPFNPNAEEIQGYTGRYFCDELETFYTLKVVDSTLTATHKNMKDINLTPLEQDSFTTSVFFMQEVSFKRDDSGSVIGFQVANGRTKGIDFVKQ